MRYLFSAHKYLKNKFDILLAIDSLEHCLTISNKVVFLYNFNQNIADIFDNKFTSLISAFFFTGLKLSPDLIKQQSDDL